MIVSMLLKVMRDTAASWPMDSIFLRLTQLRLQTQRSVMSRT